MYSYIRGTLEEIDTDSIVVEAAGIGYHIFTTAQTFSYLPAIGETVKIYTYLYIRDDAVLLYGFLTKDDLEIFKLLIGVNGIGPKGALAVLSVMTTDELRFAVLGDDAKAISKAPGIGSKTASRIILELRDKLKIFDASENKIDRSFTPAAASNETNVKKEAVMALTALGYSSSEALAALCGIAITEDMGVEELLKEALKQMAFL